MSNAFKALGRGLKKTAPALAGVLSTAIPGGPLASAAVKAIAGAVGGDPDDPAALAKQVAAADPETAAKIHAADQAFTLELRKVEVEVLKLDAGDRGDARQMQTATKSRMVPALATVTIAGFFILTGVMIWLLTVSGHDLSQGAIALIGSAYTAAAALALGVNNFYFGSSSGNEVISGHLAEKISKGR